MYLYRCVPARACFHVSPKPFVFWTYAPCFLRSDIGTWNIDIEVGVEDKKFRASDLNIIKTTYNLRDHKQLSIHFLNVRDVSIALVDAYKIDATSRGLCPVTWDTEDDHLFGTP